MSEFAFEVGQRVRRVFGFGAVGESGEVTYRFVDRNGAQTYAVKFDGRSHEGVFHHAHLQAAPLRRGDVVQRDQADAIPAHTVVVDRHYRHWQRRPDGERDDFPWLRFGIEGGFSTEYLHWPVTVVDVPGGDET